jgi:transcriptional regulator with XRE-family HTH domain
VAQAMADGELSPQVDAPRIRAFLRGQGRSCTPLQARAVLNSLRSDVRGGRFTERDHTESLGSRLAAARKEKYLSRAELARMVGCSESYLSYLETGSRSPSPQMLTALGRAVDREPAWLRSGTVSQASARIAALLARCQVAVRDDDLAQVEACVEDLLSGDLGRPLNRNELDQVLLDKAHLLGRRHRDAEAVRLLEPLVARLLRGDCALSPVGLGYQYVTTAHAAWRSDPGATRILSEAVSQTRHLLRLTPRDLRDDGWWRLAVAVFDAECHIDSLQSGLAQAVAWIDESGDSEDGVPLATADLQRRIGVALVQLERFDEALMHFKAAIELHGSRWTACHDARIWVDYAQTLMTARPEQVDSAIDLLESILPEMAGYVSMVDLWQWGIARARAEILAGRPHRACGFVSSVVVESEKTDPSVCFDAWMVMGDAHALCEETSEAGDAYDLAEDLLRAKDLLGCATSSRHRSRRWRDLGERFARLGRPERALRAYEQALAMAGIPVPPGLPPLWPQACQRESTAT